MKWIPNKSFDGTRYTGLHRYDQNGLAVELGRYWHRADGFVPESKKNNVAARATENEAREYVLRAVLQRYKQDMGELGLLLAATLPTAVPCGTSGRRHRRQISVPENS